MATTGNGDDRPPDGGHSDGLPELPEEWGRVVIPDDPAELAAEAEQVRAELAREHSGDTHRPIPAAAARAAMLIMAVTVVITLVSLFLVSWAGLPDTAPTGQPPATRNDDGRLALPDLTLTGADGAPVPLRATGPAVLLFTDGCDCADLLAETVAATAAPVAVLVIARRTAAPPGGAGSRVRTLADPADAARQALGLPPAPTVAGGRAAPVVLVDHRAGVAMVVPAAIRAAEFAAHLPALSG